MRTRSPMRAAPGRSAAPRCNFARRLPAPVSMRAQPLKRAYPLCVVQTHRWWALSSSRREELSRPAKNPPRVVADSEASSHVALAEGTQIGNAVRDVPVQEHNIARAVRERYEPVRKEEFTSLTPGHPHSQPVR